MQSPQVGGAVHPDTAHTGQVEQRGVVVVVEPRVPRCGPADGFLDHHQDPAVGPERHDLGRDPDARGRVPAEKGRHAQLERRPALGEPADEGEPRTELHEVVVRRLDGLGDEVVHDAPDVGQVARAGHAGGAAAVVGHPARPVQNARQLVLLGHVVQRVPAQVTADVVPRRSGRSEVEERRPHPVHGPSPLGPSVPRLPVRPAVSGVRLPRASRRRAGREPTERSKHLDTLSSALL